MAKILVNGISAKSGGGRSVLTNFLTVLRSEGSRHKFFVITPSMQGYSEFAGPDIEIIPMRSLSRTIFQPFTNAVVLPLLVKRLDCDVVFNLADIPMPTSACQIFLFDWAYAAYPESKAWDLGDLKGRVIRNSKLYLFKKYLHYIDHMIAQSELMSKRLKLLYGIEKIKVVPNAVSLDNMKNKMETDFGLGDGLKLLCLSHYYSHKNMEIFLPLAERIKKNKHDIKIITTIESKHGKGASSFLRAIKDNAYEDVIINIGSIPMSHVPTLYKQTDGLLLPTLLESFSGTYVEAMFHGKPIFTSNMEFAQSVCGLAAYYFDPHNPDDILKSILESQRHPLLRDQKISEGKRLLSEMPTWKEAFWEYMVAIDSLIA